MGVNPKDWSKKNWVMGRFQGCTCPPPWYSDAEAAAWLLRMDYPSCPLHEREGDLNAEVG